MIDSIAIILLCIIWYAVGHTFGEHKGKKQLANRALESEDCAWYLEQYL